MYNHSKSTYVEFEWVHKHESLISKSTSALNLFNFRNTYINLPEILYKRANPVPVSAPRLVIFNDSLAAQLGLGDSIDLSLKTGSNPSKFSKKELAAILSGSVIQPASEPIALAYAGHQFGHFTMLGDGRAHLLGEHVKPDGKLVDVALKGSGQTPYSRRGDGKATLGAMLREYIISEAMNALQIPTTRSLAVVATGENVYREKLLPGAVLTRIADSHIRIGTFEFVGAQQDQNLLETLLNYAINRHYPSLSEEKNKPLAFLKNVMERQIDLVVNWIRVGFIHGVMNSDNVAISGETIDYGPCAFMDSYDPNKVFSSIDHNGRYSFSNQPIITQWNIARLAEALLPLIDKNIEKAIELASEVINDFPNLYKAKWMAMMRAKLGLLDAKDGDEELILDFLNWMQRSKADYTNSFRGLSILVNYEISEINLLRNRIESRCDEMNSSSFKNSSADIFRHTSSSGSAERNASRSSQLEDYKQFLQDELFFAWLKRWKSRIGFNSALLEDSLSAIKNNNSAIIPRNHKVEEALNAAIDGDLNPLFALLEALKNPYQDNAKFLTYTCPPTLEEAIYQTFCGT